MHPAGEIVLHAGCFLSFSPYDQELAAAIEPEVELPGTLDCFHQCRDFQIDRSSGWLIQVHFRLKGLSGLGQLVSTTRAHL